MCPFRLVLCHSDELFDGPTEGGLSRSTGTTANHSLPYTLHLLQATSQQCPATRYLQVLVTPDVGVAASELMNHVVECINSMSLLSF